MKTRTKTSAVAAAATVAPETTSKPKRRVKPTLSVVAAETKKPGGGRGGWRPGAGRKPYLKEGSQKKSSAYVSLTDVEKEKFEALAEKRGLTLSYYLRERLGLPIDE